LRFRVYLLALSFVLCGCATSGHQSFYKAQVEPSTLKNVEFLSAHDTPRIVHTQDMDRDIRIAKSKRYVLIGLSSFNGAMDTEDALVMQARKVGASLVVTTSKFAETRTISTPLIVPNGFNSLVLPYTTHQRRFDQGAAYFVKATDKPKFGVYVQDLTPDLRSKIERNAGVVIEIVIEDSPAFAANLLPGDVLIELGGEAVVNKIQVAEVFARATAKGGICVAKIIRNGYERIVHVQLVR